MKFHPTILVEKVRKLRQKGASLRELEKKFNIPSSTISRWVRDIHSQEKTYINARIKESLLKDQSIDIVHAFKVNKASAQILVSFLYWCEGSKYPSSNCVAFSNSDFTLVKTFVELLKRAFPIDENKFRARLQIHSTHDYQKILPFWSTLLDIPKNQFYKPTITHPTKNMKRRNYVGTCTIKYYDVKLLISLMGIYENFAKIYMGKRRSG